MLTPGLILHIDLSTDTISRFAIPDGVVHDLLGGRGLAAALCADAIVDGCDPLGPDNVLAICAGLLTGSRAPSSARTHFCALSPLTGILGSSNAGGYFGADLRSCGVQGLVIAGRASRPVVLHIDPHGAELRDGSDLWGLDSRQSRERLIEQAEDPRLRVLTIGPAGENRVAMACILVDEHGAAGRTGMGAVMGAKNLKAVTVQGGAHEVQDSPAVRRAVRDYIEAVRHTEMFGILSRHGQAGYVEWCNEQGILSTRNYQSGTFEHAGAVCGSKLEDRVVKRGSCHRCPIHCKAEMRVAAGRYTGETGPRPEFESIIALGPRCGQGDPDAVLHLSNLCGSLGLDTISAGAALAFAMELYEEGIVGPAKTGGLPLVWGDLDAQAELLDQIAQRQGFGALLADGVHRAAQRIGRGSERFAHHVKGLDLCGYDPRGALGSALGYAVSGRGADFASVFATAEHRWDAERARRELGDPEGANRFSPEGKAEMVRRASICSAVVDSLGICKVPALGIPAAFDLQRETELTRALTGWKLSPDELLRVGERIINLERVFNLRFWQGPGPFDTLPEKFQREPLEHGPAAGRTVDLAPMLAEYYQRMGWDATGWPTAATLARLGLDPVCGPGAFGLLPAERPASSQWA